MTYEQLFKAVQHHTPLVCTLDGSTLPFTPTQFDFTKPDFVCGFISRVGWRWVKLEDLEEAPVKKQTMLFDDCFYGLVFENGKYTGIYYDTFEGDTEYSTDLNSWLEGRNDQPNANNLKNFRKLFRAMANKLGESL